MGLSWMEIGVIALIAIIVLGPDRLPELAKGLGKGIREFKAACSDFSEPVEQVEQAVQDVDMTTVENSLQDDARAGEEYDIDLSVFTRDPK